MSTIAMYARTTEERDVILSELGNLLTTFYKTDEKEFTNMLNSDVSLRTAELIHSLLQEQNVEMTSRTQVNQLLESLKNELAEMKTVQITLAIKPQHGFLDQLSAWINTNIQEKSLLQLTIDPQIIGGIILLHQGKYINLSLKKKVTDTFIENKDAIFSVLS